MQEQKLNKKPLEKLELSNTPTLVISDKLKRQIDYLHNKVGSNEWSGELITKEEKSIQDLDDWKIVAEDIFLADVGSPGSTSYEVDKGGFKSVDIAAMYDKFEGLLDGTLKNQHVHSHHHMECFFSGTDWENLNDRAKISNYVLMLVVNFAGKYCAKVAFLAKVKDKTESSIEFANNVDNFEGMTLKEETEKEVLVVMNCKIVHETVAAVVESWFDERFSSVKESIKEENSKKTKSLQKVGKNSQKSLFPPVHRKSKDWDTWDDEPKYNKSKKISEMTQKEWEEEQKREQQRGRQSIWETRHVFVLLNSVIHQNSEASYVSPIQAITTTERKFRDERDRNEFLNLVSFTMREKFDEFFAPKNNDEQYVDMMVKMIDFLDPYKYNKLVEDILDTCWDEMDKYDIKDWDAFNKNYENSLIM